MNYNILAYSIYSSITFYIIYVVGRMFHRNGRIFILRLFNNNAAQTDTTNNLLLVAYYLFNIGYAIMQFSYWRKVTGIESLIASISGKTGLLILILATTHYFNIAIIYILSKRMASYSLTHKSS